MCVPRVANPTMVAFSPEDDNSKTHAHKTISHQPCSSKQTKGTTPIPPKTESNCLSAIRKYYQSKGLHRNSIDILLSSWRQSTKTQYFVYIKLWLNYIKGKQPTIYTGIDFLQTLFAEQYSYYQLCMATSAISLLIHTKTGITFWKHPDVKIFIKGVFELRPVFPTYKFTWSLDVLFNFF